MADPTGETRRLLRVAFDRRPKLEFHGAMITSADGLLAYRELDDALGLMAMAASTLAEGRRGKNIRHRLAVLVPQVVYGRLARCKGINDAARLARDPAMCAVVGQEGLDRPAASAGRIGRFGTERRRTDLILAILADPSGAWIGRVQERRPGAGAKAFAGVRNLTDRAATPGLCTGADGS